MSLMMKPLGGYTLLCIYLYMCLHFHDYVMVFYLWWYYVVLRVPMDDLLQRSHMGRDYVHSTEAVWELIAREEWLGCRHDVAHVWTYPGQHQCGHSAYYFLSFHNIKTYIYVFKSICSIKVQWWSLSLSWPDEVQRMDFRPSICF